MHADYRHLLKIRTLDYLEAVQLQRERLHGATPKLSDLTEADYRAAQQQRSIDTELLVVVLHRFNLHVTRRSDALRGHEAFEQALATFHAFVGLPNGGQVGRPLANLRDIDAHRDEYDVGTGKRIKDGTLDDSSPTMHWGHDGAVLVSYRGQQLDLSRAADLAIVVASAVVDALRAVGHTVDLRFWPRCSDVIDARP